MESGRSTPIAMLRPSSRQSTNMEVNGANSARSSRPPEPQSGTSQNRQLSPGRQRPGCLRSATFPSMNTPDLNQRCILRSIMENRASSIAIIQGSFLTAIGLGWAVYSRIFRFNLEAWISKFGRPQPCHNGEALANFALNESQKSISQSPKPRLDTSTPASHLESRTPAIVVQDETDNETSDERASASLDELDKHHDKTTTQNMLQKHIAYLEPWVSKQPLSDLEKASKPESKIENDFRRMSLPAFVDLSTAIYKDVRRREQESSPQSPNPPQTPGWDGRTKENAARMVLCRTINEQYLRLVLALVLELARRIAEIRIELKRQAVVGILNS